MYIAERLLIDIEKTNNLSAYYIRSEGGKEIKTIASGKMIIPITENEHKNKIYKLLEDNCDLIFFTTDKLSNFQFYPVPMLAIFAANSNGTSFGKMGGIGGLGSDDYPVGCITKEGKHRKIVSSFKEFLELITFYPYWRDIVMNKIVKKTSKHSPWLESPTNKSFIRWK